MKEAELKFRLDERARESLQLFLKSNCTFRREERQVDVYFQHPCRDFAVTDEALRVRIEKSSGRVELCYKGPRESASKLKRREELKVRVNAKRHLTSILEKLGFTAIAAVEKKRTVYDCKDFEASIDIVEGLGTYAELELKREGSEERMLGVARKLGLTGRIEEKTYLELLLEKREHLELKPTKSHHAR